MLIDTIGPAAATAAGNDLVGGTAGHGIWECRIVSPLDALAFRVGGSRRLPLASGFCCESALILASGLLIGDPLAIRLRRSSHHLIRTLPLLGLGCLALLFGLPRTLLPLLGLGCLACLLVLLRTLLPLGLGCLARLFGLSLLASFRGSQGIPFPLDHLLNPFLGFGPPCLLCFEPRFLLRLLLPSRPPFLECGCRPRRQIGSVQEVENDFGVGMQLRHLGHGWHIGIGIEVVLHPAVRAREQLLKQPIDFGLIRI